MRSQVVAQRFLSTLPSSDRFGGGQPPSGSAFATGPTSLFRFYTRPGCLLFSPARLFDFILDLEPRPSFESIFRVTHTLADTFISSRRRSRFTTSLQSPRHETFSMAAIPSYPPAVHIFSPLREGKTPQAPWVEKKKNASAIGSVLVRTYERKAEASQPFGKKRGVGESRLAAFRPLETARISVDGGC